MRTNCCNHLDTGHNMEQVFVQFILLMTTCLPCEDTVISKVYEANPDLYNTMSINKPLGIKQTDSIVMCSALCINGYICFNFNIQTKTCLLYNSCNSSHMTVYESGWRFFTYTSLKPKGKYMLAYHFFEANYERNMHTFLLTHMCMVMPISITYTFVCLFVFVLFFDFFVCLFFLYHFEFKSCFDNHRNTVCQTYDCLHVLGHLASSQHDSIIFFL